MLQLVLIYIASIVIPLQSINVSWHLSRIETATPLYGHFAFQDNDTTYILGGYQSKPQPWFDEFFGEYHYGRQPSINIYYKQNDELKLFNNNTERREWLLYDTPTKPNWGQFSYSNDSGIQCNNNKCSALIGSGVFILNDLTLEWMVYDLNIKQYFQFLPTSFVTNYGAYDSCFITDGTIIWSLGGSVTGGLSNLNANGFMYNSTDNSLHPLQIEMFYFREGAGCNIDIYNQYIYLFGGAIFSTEETNHLLKLNIIERYSIKTLYHILQNPWDETGYKLLENAALKYYRCNFHVQVTKNNLFIIIGGTTNEYNMKLEIFNASSEEMVIPPNKIPLPFYKQRKQFATFMIDNTLYINGGWLNDGISPVNITNTTEYIDIDELFFVPQNITQNPKFSCNTVYDEETRFSYWKIDKWLYNTTNQLMFSVEGFDQDIQPKISVITAISFPEIQIFIQDDSVIFEWEYAPPKTAIQFPEHKNESIQGVGPNPNTFWISWNKDGLSYLNIGVGDTFFKYYNDGGPFDPPIYVPQDIIQFIGLRGGISYNDSGKWTFYHQECVVFLDLVLNNTNNNDTMSNTFNVGDAVKVRWNLWRADFLNTYIKISSLDILSFNFNIFIAEDGECDICYDEYDNCQSCEEPVIMMNLSTYNINRNKYEIQIENANNSILAIDAPYNPYIFQRNIIKIAIKIMIDTDTDNEIYPNGQIYIVPMYDTNKPPQQYSTIHLELDDNLGFNDSFTDISMVIDYYSSQCRIYLVNKLFIDNCWDNPLVIPQEMVAKTIEENQYSISFSSNDTYLNQSQVILSRKIQNVNISFTKQTYLGQRIDIFYHYDIDNLVQKHSEIIIQSAILGINSIIYMNYDNMNPCTLYDVATQITEICENGISFQGNKNMINTIATISLSSDNTILTETEINIKISNCPTGQGVVAAICTQCAANSIGLFNSECLSCDGIDNIECLGASNLIIAYNHWVAIHNYSNYNRNRYNIFKDNDLTITSTYCPSGYCCQNDNGCNMSSNVNILCAKNRDPSVPLCGGCIERYSEVFGSHDCLDCRNSNSIGLILIPLSMAILYSLWILRATKSQSEKIANKEISYNQLLIHDDIEAIKLAYMRPIIYFSQAMSYITIQTGINHYLTPILQILSLDTFVINSNNNEKSVASGICFYDGLSVQGKALWSLILPTFIFLVIGIMYLGYRIKLCDKIKFLLCCKKFTNFMPAFWSAMLLVIGSIFKIMFQILACQAIGNISVHFYSGADLCFSGMWAFALITLMLVIVFWIFIFVILFRMDPDERNSTRSPLSKITRAYHAECWFWEMILLSRRFIISFMITFESLGTLYFRYILVCILIIYLILQIKLTPFKYQRVNFLESVCMTLLIFALICIIITDNDTGDFNFVFVAVSLSFVMIIPIFIFLTYSIMFLKYYITGKRMDVATSPSESQQKRLDKMKFRKSKSVQNILIQHELNTKRNVHITDGGNATNSTVQGDGVGNVQMAHITAISESHADDKEEREIPAMKSVTLDQITQDTMNDVMNEVLTKEKDGNF